MTATTDFMEPFIQEDFMSILDEKITDDANSAYKAIYMVEAPPSIVGTLIGGVHYYLPLPWTYYVLTLNRRSGNKWVNEGDITSRMCSAYGRPEKLQNESDELYYMPLPNLYGGSKTFCMNNGKVDTKLTIEAQVNQAISNFWDTPFTYMRPTTEPEIWDNIAKIIGCAKISNYYSGLGPIYSWWASLSIDDVLQFPWGKKVWGTVASVKEHANYGSASYNV